AGVAGPVIVEPQNGVPGKRQTQREMFVGPVNGQRLVSERVAENDAGAAGRRPPGGVVPAKKRPFGWPEPDRAIRSKSPGDGRGVRNEGIRPSIVSVANHCSVRHRSSHQFSMIDLSAEEIVRMSLERHIVRTAAGAAGPLVVLLHGYNGMAEDLAP